MKSRYGLEIRAATPAEAPGLAVLLAAAGQTIEPQVLAARLESLRKDAGVALLALEWGPPSGVVVLHWYRTLGADRPIAQIDTLYIGPDSRRRGLGRMLLKAAAQAARVAGCDTLMLAAEADDPGLVAFCRATGFVEAGTRFLRPLRKGG